MKIKASNFLREVFICSKAILEKEHKALRRCGLSLSEYLILSSVCEFRGRKMTDIASELFVSRAAATYAVDRLVKRKLLTRFRLKGGDRRVISLKITPKAKYLLKSICAKQELLMKASFSELPEHVQKQVSAFSPQIRSFLDKRNYKKASHNQPSQSRWN